MVENSIPAEILRYFICTSGNGGHILFIRNVSVLFVQSVFASSVVLADLENVDAAFGI